MKTKVIVSGIIAFFVLTSVFLIYRAPASHKYIIKQDSRYYFTDSYTIDSNNCVVFGDYRICGTYTIEKKK